MPVRSAASGLDRALSSKTDRNKATVASCAVAEGTEVLDITYVFWQPLP